MNSTCVVELFSIDCMALERAGFGLCFFIS